MSWIKKLRDGLKTTSSKISDGVTDIFTKRKIDSETLSQLEELLITSDMGYETASEIIETIAEKKFDKETSPEEIKSAIAEEIAKILEPVALQIEIDESKKPYVIMVVGVNGNGKTTSIGKMAYFLKQGGYSIKIAAADTFRAAAVEQLKTWGERAGVEVLTGQPNQDPASVVYQSIEKSIADKTDILLVDTAGRLQNKSNLMAELSKITAVCSKLVDGAPHNVVMVLDATTGQNAISQVKEFGEKANVQGLIVTKLDGTAKGGIVVALARKFGLPIYALGVGEGIEDMKPFNAVDFAQSLVGI